MAYKVTLRKGAIKALEKINEPHYSRQYHPAPWFVSFTNHSTLKPEGKNRNSLHKLFKLPQEINNSTLLRQQNPHLHTRPCIHRRRGRGYVRIYPSLVEIEFKV